MPLEHRYDFVYLFDVRDGNPNGDPDAGNLPRVDPETGHGLVTDVCLKRKIRNYVGLIHGEQPPFEIYVKERGVLNRQHERAYTELKLKPEAKKLPKDAVAARNLTLWMCQNFYDIRAFGAVMTTEVNCGQVRGPVQLAFARSIDPIVTLEHALTRCAVTNEKDAEKKDREMGRKFTVPYALYRAHGFINAKLAEQTTFDENGQDLSLLWDALGRMFEADRSASRGEMAARSLVVFRHDSPLGNAPAHKLFERVQVKHGASANGQGQTPARSFEDYEILINDAELPAGVAVERPLLGTIGG
jgi:CRISPR-associated protein Csd2